MTLSDSLRIVRLMASTTEPDFGGGFGLAVGALEENLVRYCAGAQVEQGDGQAGGGQPVLPRRPPPAIPRSSLQAGAWRTGMSRVGSRPERGRFAACRDADSRPPGPRRGAPLVIGIFLPAKGQIPIDDLAGVEPGATPKRFSTMTALACVPVNAGLSYSKV